MDKLLYYIWFADAMGAGNKKASMMLLEEENPYVLYGYTAIEYQEKFDVKFTAYELSCLCNKTLEKATKELEFCLKTHIQVITIADAQYPQKLLHIYNPPIVLYVYGTLPKVDEQLSISIVGSRTATVYGMTVTEKISSSLAKCGVVVISGMARGIDTMANKGALYGGGKTIAVIGSGINVPYPKENRDLMMDISKSGAIVSEYPPFTPPNSRNFPARNRLISGLCDGILVVEAHQKSGSLITINLALQQGKDVFAIPGNINNITNEGCNNLIKEGSAKFTMSVYDILEEYKDRICLTHQEKHEFKQRVVDEESILAAQKAKADYEEQAKQKKTFEQQTLTEQPATAKEKKATIPPDLKEEKLNVYRLLLNGAMTKDKIAEALGLSVVDIACHLTMMEMEGHLTQLPGQRFQISDN